MLRRLVAVEFTEAGVLKIGLGREDRGFKWDQLRWAFRLTREL